MPKSNIFYLKIYILIRFWFFAADTHRRTQTACPKTEYGTYTKNMP